MSTAKNHAEARRKLRRRLEAWGAHPDVIAEQVAALAARQAVARHRGVSVNEITMRDVNRHRKAQESWARRTLRLELEEQGVPGHVIDRRVAQLRAEQAAARRAGVPLGDLDAIHDETWRQPDDSAYRPRPPDALERGPARVTSRTARAARRAKATTRYELSQQEGTPAS